MRVPLPHFLRGVPDERVDVQILRESSAELEPLGLSAGWFGRAATAGQLGRSWTAWVRKRLPALTLADEMVFFTM